MWNWKKDAEKNWTGREDIGDGYACPRIDLEKTTGNRWTAVALHLKEPLFSNKLFDKLSDAQAAAEKAFEEVRNVTPEQRYQEKSRWAQDYIVRHLITRYRTKLDELKQLCAQLTENVCEKEYHEDYSTLRHIMEEQAERYAMTRAMNHLCNKDGWKTMRVKLLEDAIRHFGAMSSTSQFSNENERHRGEALRKLADNFEFRDEHLEAAFVFGWDFRALLKQEFPKWFEGQNQL